MNTPQVGDPFLTFRMPQAEIDRLTVAARESGCSRSALVRTLLRRGLAEVEAPASGVAVPASDVTVLKSGRRAARRR